jgi:peptidyl-prolyl cis-trans isomerase A (cyclophilin A)
MAQKLFKWVALCGLVALSACGGGGSSSPLVSAIQANQTVYGQTAQFTVTGALLDQGISVAAQGCQNLSQASGGTSTSQTWTCVVDAVGTGAVSLEAKTASGAVLKTQAFDVAAPANPVIKTVQPDRLMYAQTSQFTLTGFSLDKDFTLSSRNCKGLTLLAGGTATSKTVSCTVNAVGTGAVGFDAKLADGTVLKSASFDVLAPQVTLTTTLGTMVVELNPTLVPVTVDNFLQYVKDKFYDNTIFHRVIAGFVAQGGWLTPTPAIQSGQRTAIALEVGKGLSNLRGTIAMARTSELNSATSQFFFNLADNTALDAGNGGYAVFGKLVQGLDVMDAIGKVATATQYGLSDFPVTNVVVQTAVQTR